MPIDVACKCGKAFKFPSKFAGQTSKCPDCGASISIPIPAPVPAQPAPPAFTPPSSVRTAFEMESIDWLRKIQRNTSWAARFTGCLLLIVVGCVMVAAVIFLWFFSALMSMASRDRPTSIPTPRPEMTVTRQSAPSPVMERRGLQIGERGMLYDPAHERVWVATFQGDLETAMDVQAPQAEALLVKMVEAGRLRWQPNFSRIKVRQIHDRMMHVELLSAAGSLDETSVWVQREFVRGE